MDDQTFQRRADLHLVRVSKEPNKYKNYDTDYEIQILKYKQLKRPQTFQPGKLKPGLGNQRSKGIPNVKYNIYKTTNM